MKLKNRLARFGALTLTAGAVTIGGLGLATTASADTGPQSAPAQVAAKITQDGRGGQPAWVTTDLMSVAAQALGITNGSLRQEMAQGRSLAQIAAEHGVARGALKTALVDAEDADFQRVTAAGSVTQTQRNQLVSSIPGTVDRLLSARGGSGRLGGASQFSPNNPNAGGQLFGRPGR